MVNGRLTTAMTVVAERAAAALLAPSSNSQSSSVGTSSLLWAAHVWRFGACAQAFMDALSWFDSNALARHASGPYLLGESFSVLDIMAISSMERLAAGGAHDMVQWRLESAHMASI
jgi:glutathione S-transferase